MSHRSPLEVINADVAVKLRDFVHGDGECVVNSDGIVELTTEEYSMEITIEEHAFETQADNESGDYDPSKKWSVHTLYTPFYRGSDYEDNFYADTAFEIFAHISRDL